MMTQVQVKTFQLKLNRIYYSGSHTLFKLFSWSRFFAMDCDYDFIDISLTNCISLNIHAID